MYKQTKTWLTFYQPRALTFEGWDEFNIRFKEKAPVRYALYNFKNYIERKIIYGPRDIKDWIKYRTIARYHIVNTLLKPGYHEADQLILHSTFTLLQSFVEVHCAHMYKVFYPRRHSVFTNKRSGQEYIKRMQRADPRLERAYSAILMSYKYWTTQRPQRIKLLEYLYTLDYKCTENTKKVHEQEKLLSRLDKVHLYKIIKFREHLWT
jgi:hypothetical protein